MDRSGIGGGFMPLPGRSGWGSLLAVTAPDAGTEGAFRNAPIGGGAVLETGSGAETAGTTGAGMRFGPGSGALLGVPVEASPGSGGTSRLLWLLLFFSSGLFTAKSQTSSPSCETANRPSEPQASAEERSRLWVRMVEGGFTTGVLPKKKPHRMGLTELCQRRCQRWKEYRNANRES